MRKLSFMLAFLLFIGMHVVSAQTSISGTVLDDKGDPVPGANVRAKGYSDVGTITDLNGQYTLDVPAEATTLVYSFVGMTTKEVEIAGQTVINVTFESGDIGLEEVVVTALGINRSEKSLGYATTSIDGEDAIQKTEPDMLRSLQGKIPGVNISASAGDPGGATRITIRGNSSFLGNNQPLFVVDGIPYSNTQYTTTSQSSSGGNYGTGISTLDPNDIESVTVLKGAAASTLYGSRAANGVILIKTKSGSSKVSQKGLEIEYRTALNWEQISNLPEYQNTYGNGTNFNFVPANGSWGARFDSRDSIPLWNDYANAFPEMGDSIPWQAYPDNVKDLFDIGFMQEHSVSLRGGSEKSSLNATASWLDQSGYIPNSSFGRSNMSIGGTHELENGLIVSGNLSYSKTKQIGGVFGNNQSTADGVASSFARTLWLGRAWDMNLPYENPVTGGPLFMVGSQADNPLWSWKHNQVTSDMDRTVGNISLTYPINDWLSVSYQIGVNTLVLRRKQITDIGSRAYNGVGAIITDNVWSQEIESNFIITAERNLTDDLNLKVVAGHNVNQSTTDRQAYRGRTIISPGIYDVDNTATVTPFGGDYSQRRLWAMFADVSLGYKNFLYLNLTGRNDRSSTLPESNNSYWYYSASSSFVITDAFDIGGDILDFAKIRASYAR